MHRENWDDLRFVLAVAEHGSLAAAARALGVNHATVLRRVSAFEARHDLQLFERGPSGYRIPPERLAVIDAAREVAAAMAAVERSLRGLGDGLGGCLRVTSTDSLSAAVLPEILAEIRADQPELRLELVVSNAHLDLARLQADVAVRPAAELAPELAGESPARLGFAVYGPRAAAGGGDAPAAWLGLNGPLRRTAAAGWMAEHVPESQVVGGADSFLALAGLAAAGMGLAILPCILGDRDPRLERRECGLPPLSVPIWVARHADLAGVPRLMRLCRWLCGALARRAAMLAGEGAALRA